jgi:hypothetical protein
VGKPSRDSGKQDRAAGTPQNLPELVEKKNKPNEAPIEYEFLTNSTPCYLHVVFLLSQNLANPLEY